MVKVDDYRELAPRGTVDLILRLAERVRGRHSVHVSAGRYGGGAAEMPQRLVPLLGDLGIDARWEVIGGDQDFFNAARALHAALEGEDRVLTEQMLAHYLDMARVNAQKLRLEGDLIEIHDPQPIALVEHRGGGVWVWRCHMDLAAPQRRAWGFVSRYLARYDAAIFSHPRLAPRIGIRQFLILPSIDPLSDRNRELPRAEVRAIVQRLGLDDGRPFLLQVGPLDRARDPVGTISAYRLVKKHHDVRLVLAGRGSAEALESAEVVAQVRDAAARDRDIVLLELPPEAHVEINAVGRAAAIVVQKSVRDRFGLEVVEAMWKGKPVVGGSASGVGIQMIPDVTGYAVDSVEGAAFRLRQLLANPGLMARMGGAGREHVRRHFLITRHLADYLALLGLLGAPS
jgi:trehalose synthase